MKRINWGSIASGVLIVILTLILLPVSAKAELADSPSPKFHGDLRNTGQSQVDTSHIDGTVSWKFKTSDGIESSPSIGQDGTIYFGSHDNNLYAINPDGSLKWKFSAGEPIYNKEWNVYKGIMSTPAIASDGTIYFSSMSNFLFALDANGKLKWKFPMKVTADTWSSPTISSDGTVYIGSARSADGNLEVGGNIYAINPDGTKKWEFKAESDVFPTMAIGNDGTLYTGNGASGKFYAIKSDGTLKWQFQTGKHIESSAAIAEDGTIYFGSWDDYIYALNPDGSEKWKIKTRGDGIVATPAISSDGTLYIVPNDGDLYAIDGQTGKIKWQKHLGNVEESNSSVAIGKDGTLFVGFADGMFYAFSPNGEEKWKIKTGGGVGTSPAIAADGTIYFGSWDKNLYAVGKSSKTFGLLPSQNYLPWSIIVGVFLVAGILFGFWLNRRGGGRAWLWLKTNSLKRNMIFAVILVVLFSTGAVFALTGKPNSPKENISPAQTPTPIPTPNEKSPNKSVVAQVSKTKIIEPTSTDNSASSDESSSGDSNNSNETNESTPTPTPTPTPQPAPSIYLPFSSSQTPDAMTPMGETIYHSEGHRGIDFQWTNPAETITITASMEGEVAEISPNDNWSGTWDLIVNNGKYFTSYSEMGSYNTSLQVGSKVSVGDFIGNPQHPASLEDQPNFRMIHWEFGYVENRQALCPLAYFTASAKSSIEAIWASTNSPELKANAPEICYRQYAQ